MTLIDRPVVLETHAGYGVLFEACYTAVDRGIAIDKKPEKASYLAQQRPTWSVYEADAVAALAAGCTNHLPINFVDLDPYGEPWPVLDAFLAGRDQLPDRWALVVNDGLKQGVKMGISWKIASLAAAVQKYGNAAIADRYLDICQEMVKEKAAGAGYRLDRWGGYYCGLGQNMTHYAAILVRQ